MWLPGEIRAILYARREIRVLKIIMMTSSNENIFRVTGPLCGKLTGDRWIPLTKASDAELWCFFDLRLYKRLSNDREAGDLRCHHAHYDVNVLWKAISCDWRLWLR